MSTSLQEQQKCQVTCSFKNVNCSEHKSQSYVDIFFKCTKLSNYAILQLFTLKIIIFKKCMNRQYLRKLTHKLLK